MNKFLAFFSILLILVSLIELGFLFFQTNISTVNSNLKTQPLKKISSKPDESEVVKLFNNQLKNGDLYESVLENVYKGTVIELVPPPEEVNKGKYDERMKIRSLGTSSSLYFYFKKSGENKVKVVEDDKNQVKEVPYEAIQKGDTVLVDLILDMKKPPFNRQKSASIRILKE